MSNVGHVYSDVINPGDECVDLVGQYAKKECKMGLMLNLALCSGAV
jgi:hypothetical protein